MGLAIETGILADLVEHDPEGAEWVREDLQKLNTVLEKHGLPEHLEPDHGVPDSSRAPVGSFPYSFIHYLRRVAAYRFRDPDWVAQPLPEGADPTRDPVVDAEYELMRSHLMCHSDAEGYYLPVEFDEVIFADEELVPGGMLGSSQRLLEELRQIAPALGIRLTDGDLPDAEVDRLSGLIDDEKGLWIELVVWLALFEAARVSVQQGTAVAFC